MNLILNKETVKELIQSDVNAKNIKSELKLILTEKEISIKKDYKNLKKLLRGENIESKIVYHINNN